MKLLATVGMWVDTQPVRMTTRLRLSQLVAWRPAATREELKW
jgi:endonuclease III